MTALGPERTRKAASPLDEADSSSGKPSTELAPLALLEFEVGEEERAWLREAAQFTGVRMPAELMRLALKEMVERHRVRSWLEEQEKGAFSV